MYEINDNNKFFVFLNKQQSILCIQDQDLVIGRLAT
jgi:hypothetical protein